MNVCEDVWKKVGSLPPLPATAVRVLSVVNDPDSQVHDLVEAIRYDPALTARLLRICNSAYHGLSRRTHSLGQAVAYLGTTRVTQLVMAIHAGPLVEGEYPGYGLARGALWRHSVAVAIASRNVAARLKLANMELAFTAGLLHDIGKVVLNEFVARQFGQIIRLVREEGLDFLEAENRVLGCTHEHLGAEVARQWRLPDALVRCIRYHHDPDALQPPEPLVDAVYLANCLCLLLGLGLGDDGLSYRANPMVMARHGLGGQELEVIGLDTLDELGEVERAFGLRAGRPDHGVQRVE